MFNTIAKVLTLVLLVGVLLERRGYATARDAEPFHQAVTRSVELIPSSFGSWKGTPVEVPMPARKLLRPSAMLARLYRDTLTGREATLVIVHCPDTRDLAGHYPLRCYPTSGWSVIGEPQQISVTAGGTTIPLCRYEFAKHNLEVETRQVVYGTFLIPGMGAIPDMDAVYERASDYRARLYGATQVQVIFGDGFPPRDEEAAVAELLEQAWPVFGVVKSRGMGS